MDDDDTKRATELLGLLNDLRRGLESKKRVEGEQPNVKFEEINELVPPITDLVSQAVRHVLEDDDNDEYEQSLEELSQHEEDSQDKELVIALLGKAEVGKSFVCSTLASVGLGSEDVQKLNSMSLHGSGTTRSFTTMATEFRWGPQVTREVEDSICRVTVPSPLLQEFNVRLVDTPGLMQSDHEHDKKATDATLKYYEKNIPDAVWILPSFANRRPDDRDIVLALRHLHSIGVFKCEPVMTPSVTYLFNKPGIEEKERQECHERFHPQVKRAIQHVFNLNVREIRDKVETEHWKFSESLKKELKADLMMQNIRAETNGNVNAYYHYHRLDFQWFVNDSTSLGTWWKEQLVKLVSSTKARGQIMRCRELQRWNNIAKMGLCARKEAGARAMKKIQADKRIKQLVKAFRSPSSVQKYFTTPELLLGSENLSYLRVRLDNATKELASDRRESDALPPLPDASVEWCLREEITMESFKSCMEEVVLMLVRSSQEHIRSMWLLGADVAKQLASENSFQDEPSQEILKLMGQVCRDAASVDHVSEMWKSLRPYIIDHCVSVFLPEFRATNLLGQVTKLTDKWNRGPRPKRRVQPTHLDQFMQAYKDIESNVFTTFECMSFLDLKPKGKRMAADEQRVKALYNLTLECEKCLLPVGRLEYAEFPDDRDSRLEKEMDTRPLKLKKASEKNVANTRKKIVTTCDPAFTNIQLETTTNDGHEIECFVDLSAQSIRYRVPHSLQARFAVMKDTIVLVPSKKRPGCEMSSSTYPNLFAEEWSQEPGPSVILVVDEPEAQEYREYLGSQLYRTDNPLEDGKYGFVVLMPVSWSDQNWRLNIGRKRQVMKLLMDKLNMQAAGPDQYITHDDDLERLETLSEIRTPLTLTVRSATRFLLRIMNHERDVDEEDEPQDEIEMEEPDPDDPTKLRQYKEMVPLISNFLTELSAGTHLHRDGTFRRLSERARTHGIDYWKKELSPKGVTNNWWNELTAFVGPHLKGAENSPVWDKWNYIISLHDRVAMVSVLNRQFTYGEKAVSSMMMGKYTHSASIQMYSFVLHHVPSTRHLNFVHPEEFFTVLEQKEVEKKLATLGKMKKAEQKESHELVQWAQQYGFMKEDKRFANAAKRSQRLTLATPLIGMYRRNVPSVVHATPSDSKSISGKRKSSRPASGPSQKKQRKA